jgi:hypothetical protein
MFTPGGFQASSSSSLLQTQSKSNFESQSFSFTQTPNVNMSSQNLTFNSKANTFRNGNDQNGHFIVRNNEGTENDDFFERNPDVHLWDPEQVRKWLVANHMDDLTGERKA